MIVRYHVDWLNDRIVNKCSCTDVVMCDGTGDEIRAPKYTELFALVGQLREQVEALTTNASRNNESNSVVTTGVPSNVSEFRVLPDLNKSVNPFNGRETLHQAEDWIGTINGLAAINCWPESFKLEFVRMNVRGAANDWYAGRSFMNWTDFERQFRATFTRSISKSDRWDAMRNRRQGKEEHLMDYYQSKLRLCRDLLLEFGEVKDHILRGLNSRELAMWALGRVHIEEGSLLKDLMEWQRLNEIRMEDDRYLRPYQPKNLRETKTQTQPSKTLTTESVNKPHLTWARSVPVTTKSTEQATGMSKADASATMCWGCKKTGHLSRDCPLRRKNACFHCGVVGHMRPECPERNNTNTTMMVCDTVSHPYRKVGRINGRAVEVLLDTGSHHTLIKASVAIRCGLVVIPKEKPLYGIGSTVVPSVSTLGEANTDIVIDGVSAGKVMTLVVPDAVQRPDVIVGRSWLDSPLVAYHKAGGQLHIYCAEPLSEEVEAAATELGNEADYLHVVEAVAVTEKKPLVVEDFAFVNEAVSDGERTELMTLLNRYRDCFAKNLGELGCTPKMTVNINEVPGSSPVVCRPYKTSAADRDEIAKIVREWKDNGLVEDTQSPYASPVLLVKQPGGKNRLCVDYRKLNKQTIRQHFPLPDMFEELESLASSTLFTQLDLASGYLQIPLSKEASSKTAFITADTTGQFVRMPFGLSGAVAEFTRLMQEVLGPLRGKVVRNYLDDMVIDGLDWTDMLYKLGLVLERLREANLTLKPSKCSFGSNSIEFLGFVIEGGRISPGKEKSRAIADYPTPRDAHAVRRFLGLTGFFRRFVEGYSVIAGPLTQLTRKDADFVWTDKQESSFRKLQQVLVSEPVLTMFRPNAEITELHTDASAVGLGALLMQSVKSGGPLRLVYCASRKTSDAESRYHSSKLELLCVVWAINKLRQYLLGVPFTVYTDCQALVYLNSCKTTNSQVSRWHDSLQEFDYAVKYRSGARMAHVDALSRAPVADEEPPFDDVLGERLDVCAALTEEERVLMCQTADVTLARLREEVGQNQDQSKKFILEKGLLYRSYRDKLLFVMPRSMRKSLTVVAHDLSGHPAVDRTVANILQDFWFPGMRRYVRQHVRMCFECLLARNPRGKRPGLLHPIPLGRRPFETVHMDHVGPFVTSRDGNKYILVLVDNFTKFVVLYAVRSTSAEALLASVKKFVQAYGLPRRFITDRGTCYTSGAFENYCVEQGIRLVLTSSRHPQANGQVERAHSVVMGILRTRQEDPDCWDLALTEVQHAMNNSESKVTTRTPFEMLHGYRPRIHQGNLRQLSRTADDWAPPEELRELVRVQMELAKSKMKEAYDRHRHDNLQCQVGEVVVMKRNPNSTGESTKLQDRYRGPLVVTEVLPGDVYRVAQLDNQKRNRFATTAHISQLKSWKLEPEGSEEDLEEEEGRIGRTRLCCEEEQMEAKTEERTTRLRKTPAWMEDYEMS